MEPATNVDQITVIEHTNFVVSDGRGDMEPGGYHGFYVADTRYLSRFALRLGGRRLERLTAGTEDHDRAAFYLASPHIGRIPPHTVAVFRDRRVGVDLHERIRLVSYAAAPLHLRVSLLLGADFADIFEVRGRSRLRRRIRVEHRKDHLRFVYERGGYRRVTSVRTDRRPMVTDGRLAFDVVLQRGTPWDLNVQVASEQSSRAGVRALAVARRIDPGRIARWAGRVPVLDTDDPRLLAAWGQAIRDMRALLLAEPGGDFIPAAGLPWYMAIFGRDAATTAIQSLITGGDIAYGTLRGLASYQGTTLDAFREEEPGKIPHEVRVGELATLGRVPHGRYYGAVDATPLFVILFVEACRWSGWLPPDHHSQDTAEPMPRTLRRLLPAAARALAWIDRFGVGRDGLVWYGSQTRGGIGNQAWKDSHDSYRYADGRVAGPPIAPIEVQGYVVAARRGMADVHQALGHQAEADRLRTEAAALVDRIDDAYWLADAGHYSMGIDGHGRPIDAVTSNPGHLLWSGAVSPARAAAVAERLLAPDMFSGWGIRTMSNDMPAYNPISYHNGTVWPHDNGLIAAGLARYGLKAEAWRVLDGMLDASQQDPTRRLPELFAGFDRATTRDLVDYPAACAPQAWATGAIFQAVSTILGIEPAGGRAPTLDPIDIGPRVRLTRLWVGGWEGSADTNGAISRRS